MSGESPYEFRPSGGLKLKGDKKKKSKSKADREHVKDSLKADLLKKNLDHKDTPSPSGSPGPSSSSNGYQTEAQRRFEETQRKRLERKVAKMASQTHKDRVSEFNSKLESLSEHHDIPKVGPG